MNDPFTTGNPERDAMVRRAIEFCERLHDPLTVENVSAAGNLPTDFALELSEIQGFTTPAGPEPVPVERPGKLLIETLPTGAPIPQAPAETLEKIEAPHAAEAEPSHKDTADEAPEAKILEEHARSLLEAAHERLANARVNLRVVQEKINGRGGTKAVLANAIESWQRASEPGTQAEREERHKRQFLADEQAKRVARQGASRSAREFVQKRMVNGPARGAFSMQQAARVGFTVAKRG